MPKKYTQNCCKHNKTAKKCRRKTDNKIFHLPRRFTKTQCKTHKIRPDVVASEARGHRRDDAEGSNATGRIKGFSMRSSCAPYNGCEK